MTEMPTLAHHILRLAASQPDSIAFKDKSTAVSYRNLRNLAVNFALHMRAKGIAQGGCIAVATSDLSAQMASVLAAALLGARWLVATPWALRSVRVDLLLADRPLSHPAFHLLDPDWARLPDSLSPDQPAEFPQPDPTAPWLVFPTDAVDPAAKAIELSLHLVGARVGAAIQRRVPQAGAVACLLPSTGVDAILVQLAILAQGGSILTDPDGAAQIVTAPDSPADPNNPTPTVIIADPRRAFTRPDTADLAVEYSTAAASVFVIRSCVDGQTRSRLAPHQEAALVDEDGASVALGQEGILCLRGPLIAPVAANPEGWHITDQMAIMDPLGNLTLTRPHDGHFVMQTGILNAGLIDMAMRSVAGVADAMCFLLPRPDKPPRLTAFLRYQAGVDSADVAASVRIEVIRVAGLASLPEKFLTANDLPRKPDGAPDREACARMVQSAIAKRRKNA